MLYIGTTKVCPVITPTKYGAEINNTLGNVNNSGILQYPSATCDLNFTGVKNLVANVLQYKFYKYTNIGSVSFPDLTSISTSNSMYYTFDTSSVSSISFPKLATVSGTNSMYRAFGTCPNLTSVSFPLLTNISGSSGMSYIFTGSGVTSASFGLTSLTGGNALNNAFSNCLSLTTLDFSKLTTMSSSGTMSYMCQNDTALTTVKFDELKTIGTNSSATNNLHFGNAFKGCSNLVLTFPKLETIYCTGTQNQGSFYSCDGITKLYFPKLTTITYGSGATATNQVAFKNLFLNCTNLTEIHFAQANQTAIQANAGYSTLWGRGAGSATVYFDL